MIRDVGNHQLTPNSSEDGHSNEGYYMQSIEFTAEEQEVLTDVLQHGINEIDIEVFRTDTHDFKQMLKHRRDLLEHMLSKLSATPVPAH